MYAYYAHMRETYVLLKFYLIPSSRLSCSASTLMNKMYFAALVTRSSNLNPSLYPSSPSLFSLSKWRRICSCSSQSGIDSCANLSKSATSPFLFHREIIAFINSIANCPHKGEPIWNFNKALSNKLEFTDETRSKCPIQQRGHSYHNGSHLQHQTGRRRVVLYFV